MTNYDSATLQDVATDDCDELDRRDAVALTRCMTVLEPAPGLYEVVSDSGKSYDVEPDLGVCSCPDYTHRQTRCIHLRRVAFATGHAEIPAWVDRDAVDEQLGIHVEGPAFARDETPKTPIPDGGRLAPEITSHYEPYEQGGRRYHRCTCGRESIHGAGGIAHTEACPRRRDGR